MKWFKHQTDASEDIKIKRLEAEFQLDGYACFFKIVEKVGKEGKKYQLLLQKYPLELLAVDFKIPLEKLQKILEKMGDLMLIDKNKFKKGIIYIPNMRRYADDYTDRGRRYYVEKKDTLTLEEKRRDKNRKEERQPFFNGLKMRKKDGKWFCIPKDGGEWLEFAGREKDIIYK
jgi:hypothetical protein